MSDNPIMKTGGYYRRIFNAYVFNKNGSNLSFWHTELKANSFSEEDRDSVRRYPMNFSEKTKYNKHVDDDGVIMLDYGGDLGIQYNPNAIAQAALGYYELYLDAVESGNEADKEKYAGLFLTQANWFINHGRTVKDDILLWEYEFAFEFREPLKSPWRSALAQGQAISVLIRAYSITKKPVYMERADKGFNSFRHDCMEHEGGVVFRKKDDVWLEEVVLSKANHILNGFVWALWGVRDYAVFTSDEYAKRLYDETEKTLYKSLDSYDVGFWTCYDDIDVSGGPLMPVSSYYQKLHTVQMEGMYEITGREVYQKWQKKWRGYYDNRLYRSIGYCWKVYFKLRYW